MQDPNKSKWIVAHGGMPSQAPNQLKKEEWSPQDYADNIRWFISRGFNQPIYNSALKNGAKQTPYDSVNTGHVTQYIRAVSYLFGMQFGTEYDWAAKDSNNNNTKIPMWRGIDVRNIFHFFDGQCRAKFQNIPKVLQAQGVTEGIISKKRYKLDAIKRIAQSADFIKLEAEKTGVTIDFEQDGMNLASLENQEKYFRTFQDLTEKAYRNIGKDFLIRNHFLPNFLKSSSHTFIGGRTMTKIYDSKGRTYLRTIAPQNAIIDMSQDDDHHYKDNFAGSIEAFSIPELQSMDDYTEDELAVLQNMAVQNPNIPIGTSGFVWYNMNNNVPKIWRAEIEWRSICYVDGIPVQCIRQGTLVGDVLLKNCKIKENSIPNKFDKSQKELDYVVFTPFTFLNTNMGVIMMVHKLIDLKSALMTKWTEMFSKAKGKIPFLDTSKFPSFMKTPDILAEIEQQGFLAGNRAEAEGEAERTNKMLENLDFTLDANVNTIMAAMEYIDRQIGQIINMPLFTTQGTSGYQSSDQIANNVQSTDIGTSWLYGGLQTHFLRIIDRAIEKTILVSSKNDEEYLSLIIGDTETDLLSKKDIQELLMDGFRPYLQMNNEITEQTKEMLKQITIQNAAINPNAALDLINYIQAETMDDARVYAEEQSRKRIEMEQAREAQAQQAAERNATINANAQMQNTQMQTEASLQMNQEKNDAALLEAALKEKNQTNK